MANPQLAELTAEERGFYDHIKNHTGPFWQNNVLPAYERLSLARASEDRKRKLLEKIKKKCVATRRGLNEPVENYDKAFKNIIEIEIAIAAELAGTGE